MKNVCGLILGAFLMGAATQARAVTIEGNTPSGKFKTVFVTEQGRLPVEIDSTTIQHVIVDTGTATVFQGGTWTVNLAGTLGGGLTVIASTCATTVAHSVTVSSSAAVICYPADANRKQGVLCNDEDSIDVFIGPAGSEYKLLPAGACYSPDTPSSFTGQLSCASTATAKTDYIYEKTP